VFTAKRLAGICVFATAAVAMAEEATKQSTEELVDFSDAYLSEPTNIEAGKVVWEKQCRHCHGKAAYPGKAPKLKPYKYEADFVFDRVSNGFRKMPGWKEVFSKEERMNVVAYILSDKFSP